MECSKCHSQLPEGSSQCNYCGEKGKVVPVAKKGNKIVTIIIFLVFAGLGIYGSLGDKGRQQNETALDLLDKQSDYAAAITQLESAVNNTYNKEEKINVLKNLGYAYWMNLDNAKAKAAFNQALALTAADSFDYYLIAGELALLEENPLLAKENYEKAYQKEPDNYQINSSLGLFYLGFDEVTQDYIDYEQALKYKQQAYDSNQDSEISKENLANNYFYLENYDQAIGLYLQTNLATKAFNNYMLGLSYYAKEDLVNSKKYLQQAKDLGFELEPEAEEILTTI
jgi:tetratricopeptide (TPR) repeat protein